MKKYTLFDKVSAYLPYLLVFITSLYSPMDPDLGWHLKYGEYFWQHGSLLRDNTFSTMMPGFHWANTSWLTDIISYAAYHIGGFFGLTLLGAMVVTGTFYFLTKAFSLTLWQQTLVFSLVLYLEQPINAVSFRGQQLALFFLAVLFYLISVYKRNPHLLWFSVPLFFVWAAIDGEFLLGFALFGLWAVLYILKRICEKTFGKEYKATTVKKNISFYSRKALNALVEDKKEIISLVSLLVGSFAATFINPFGYGIHLDAISHIGSPLLKDISEYLPFTYLSGEWWNEMIVGIILIFGLFILCFRGKFWELFPTLGGGLLLFILSLQIRRYAWPSYYLVFPLFAMMATFLKPERKKVTHIASVVLLSLMVAGAIWQRYPFTKYRSFSWDEYCMYQTDPCSSKSARYIITHHLNHNIYTLYGWGGWLIWNYPQIKPSIDGRMHMWVQNSYSAFTDYYSVEQGFTSIDATAYTVVYVSPDKSVYTQLVQVSKEGKWKEVYKDQYAGIFEKSK